MNKSAFITQVFGAIFFLVISTPSLSSTDPKNISTDDLFDLKELSLVDLSKSGNEIIYSLSAVNSKDCLLYTSPSPRDRG